MTTVRKQTQFESAKNTQSKLVQVPTTRKQLPPNDYIRSTEVQPMLLKASDAALMLQVCEKTLWTWTKQGIVPVVKVGAVVRYSVDALREWISSSTTKRETNG